MESTAHQMNSLDWNQPDAQGHFGPFGGRYVPETLMHPLKELEQEYFTAQVDPAFQQELSYYLKEFVGRPTPLYFAERLTRHLGGAKSLSQARRSAAHRCAQDQQLDGPDIIGQAHGQKSALSRKQEPDSMEWPPLRWRRCLGWSASSTWVKSIASDRRSTFFG